MREFVTTRVASCSRGVMLLFYMVYQRLSFEGEKRRRKFYNAPFMTSQLPQYFVVLCCAVLRCAVIWCNFRDGCRCFRAMKCCSEISILRWWFNNSLERHGTRT